MIRLGAGSDVDSLIQNDVKLAGATLFIVQLTLGAPDTDLATAPVSQSRYILSLLSVVSVLGS